LFFPISFSKSVEKEMKRLEVVEGDQRIIESNIQRKRKIAECTKLVGRCTDIGQKGSKGEGESNQNLFDRPFGCTA